MGAISQLSYQLPSEMILIDLPEASVGALSNSNTGGVNWLLLIWGLGALTYLLALMMKLRLVVQIKDRAKALGNHCYQLSKDDSSIGAFSFWKWIFLPDCEDPHLLECMLVHEKVHRSEKHSAERLAMELIKLIFWFNPAVYLLDQVLKQFHERQADALALKTLNRDQYVNALLSSSFGLKTIQGFVQPFTSKKHIKTRINMIYKPKNGTAALIMMVAAAGILSVAQGCSKRIGEVDNRNKVETSVDVSATFPGGNEAMFEYIFANLKYPNNDASEGVEGMVVLSFVVEASGEVSNVDVKKSLGKAFDVAAIGVVESFPKWQPSMKDGAAVASELTLPIKFVLED